MGADASPDDVALALTDLGVVGHAPGGVDWKILAVGGAASVPGALAGARLSGRLSERTLLSTVGAILVVAGVGILAQGVVRLT